MMEIVTKRVEAGVDGLARFIANHWLFLANVALLAFILPTLSAPYSGLCWCPLAIPCSLHHLSSYMPSTAGAQLFPLWSQDSHLPPLFGYLYIFLGAGATVRRLEGHALGPRRHRPSSLPIKWLVALVAPMFIDGVTQLVELREGIDLLRTITVLWWEPEPDFLFIPYWTRDLPKLGDFTLHVS